MSESRGPIAALHVVLNELIELVQDVKQAHRKVPGGHALHSELDQLFADLRRWAEELMQEDQALGVSPLADVSSVAGRTPKNLWPSAATDDEVRDRIAEHLGLLNNQLAAALDDQDRDGHARSLLRQIQDELRSHVERLTVTDG